MDLLKSMLANRDSSVRPLSDPKPRKARGKKKETKADRAKAQTPGTKAMRNFIIEEKPGKKVVKEHFEGMIESLCESSSDEE